ncbi:hypothetical protein ABZ369_06430 [Streptomyces sp. NPDC005918]|uniref:hypothetical protein n=1 Tax=Streptomyces sp. NPDC005918 TaxID=3155454 RepID=UPI0033FC5715
MSDYRQADMVDELGRIFVALYNAHRDERAPELPWPEPVPRPGADKAAARAEKAAERERRVAREGYEDIVSQVAPGRI